MSKKRFDTKGRELFCGEYERADGRYEYRYRDREGKRICIYATNLASLRREEAKIHLLEHINISKQITGVTLNDQYEIWITGKQNIRRSTAASYMYLYDSYLRNSLGRRLIDEINTYDIKCFYMSMKTERRLSTETISHIQNVLYQVFQSAVDRNILFRNPAERACKDFSRSHSKHTSTRKGLSQYQADMFLEFVRNTDECKRWFPLFCMLTYTGLRISEISGLFWEDIHEKEEMIDINHALTWFGPRGEKGRFQINPPKTPAGFRQIPISLKIKEALEMERAYQKEAGLRCSVEVDGYSDFVFLNRFGSVITQASVNRALRRVVFLFNNSNLTDGDGQTVVLPSITSHSLRHTFANILCENNVNIKVIQKLMGQSDIETTMNIYTEVSERMAFEEYKRKLQQKKRRNQRL